MSPLTADQHTSFVRRARASSPSPRLTRAPADTYLHSNANKENYLLTPSDAGDLCVAKLFPPSQSLRSGASSNSHGSSSSNAVKCEASRNLRWSISNTGIQNPVYKLTLPNPDQPQQDQPLFQVSKQIGRAHV